MLPTNKQAMAAASTVQDLLATLEEAADAAAARAPAVALCEAVKAQGDGEPDTAASLALLCAAKARCVAWVYMRVYVRSRPRASLPYVQED